MSLSKILTVNVRVPTFNGFEPPIENWISDYEQITSIIGWSDKARLVGFPDFLTGVAQLLFKEEYSYEYNFPQSWSEAKERLIKDFTPITNNSENSSELLDKPKSPFSVSPDEICHNIIKAQREKGASGSATIEVILDIASTLVETARHLNTPIQPKDEPSKERKIICYFCKEPGHIRQNCRQLKYERTLAILSPTCESSSSSLNWRSTSSKTKGPKKSTTLQQ
ncbi:uncharacterized protein LOC128385920 [Panonychus citri]|uniref:uncharacterized protein LOC128385920 n=1 Tax=Panonychus citri TaxID=50023 RepID=UPI0023074557|nr:uncharacterized protein LOC128385920 [Panonychus citri]